MLSLKKSLCFVICLLAAPTMAFAQASIGGTVKDTSGAVLPGVTVEASSPALIEKVRSVVTDGTGQYKIVDLRPGMYDVTFTLSGFSAIKREGIELTGSFAATVNIELKVGSVQETITVTSESPIVDVQNATKQRVMGSDVLDSIPTGRTHYNAAILIPGMTASSDVGGTNNLALANMTLHGGRTGDTRVLIDGLSTANAEQSGNVSNFIPNMGSAQELTVDYSAGSAEQPTGGVRMNLIPREGGNTFKGSFFGTATNSSFQGSNYTQDLKDRGLQTPDSLKSYYDFNPGAGGPIAQDKLWFYASGRWNGNENNVGNLFYNKNAGLADVWTYVPDTSQPAYYSAWQRSINGRLTWQATPKQKVSVFWDDQGRCQCRNVFGLRSPEAANDLRYPVEHLGSIAWTSAVTNRLLLEGRFQTRLERYSAARPPSGDPSLLLIPVTEQSTGLLYHGGGYGYVAQPTTQPYQTTLGTMSAVVASMSYVTGAHAFKVGFSDYFGWRNSDVLDSDTNISYRFNLGVPNQLRMNATPFGHIEKQNADIGLYAQDRWTLNRLTLNLGVRLDYYANSFPEQHLGPGRFVPTRDVTYPETSFVSWKDVTPRIAAAYDVFGDGKTAVKASVGKYMVAFGLQGAFGEGSNPVIRLANFVTRNWTDLNRNFSPDCDLLNPAQNLECGAMSDASFGKPTASTAVDPAILSNDRGYNWEFSTGVQRQLLPRLSVDVSYFRRIYGNFTVTDNRAVAGSDYSPYSITAPLDSRLPDGGGYAVSGLYDLNPNKVGQVDNNFTLASNYGNQIEHWNGVDFTINSKPRNGILLQGGVSTGRTVTDNCDIVTQLDNPSTRFCHVQTAFLTQLKFLGSYTLPKVDVQISGTLQSVPGPQISANYAAPNALVQPSLGRALSGGAQNVTINLVQPGTMYGERLNQVDWRFSKILKYAKTRTLISLDLYNAFNANTVLSENSNFASWRVPNTILQARFARISAQFDF